jgi:hypothetical protein
VFIVEVHNINKSPFFYSQPDPSLETTVHCSLFNIHVDSYCFHVESKQLSLMFAVITCPLHF